MDIVFSADTNYIMPTGVMMTSVCINNQDTDITFHALIDESVTEKQKQQLEDVCAVNSRHHILYYVMDASQFSSLPKLGTVKRYITQATYYRLFLTEILPADLEKVLYLDGDIIVTESLSDLWNTHIGDCAIGCVTDMSEAVHDYSRLGYPPEHGYFNAGVLLINLNYWRKNCVVDLFNRLMEESPERILLHDQDVLNISFYNCKYHLSLKYNLQHGFLFKKQLWEIDENKYENCIMEAIKQPIIIHYTFGIKPWHIECDNPLRNKWLFYLKKTQWKNYKLKRKYPLSFKNRVASVLRKLQLLPQYRKEDYQYIL